MIVKGEDKKQFLEEFVRLLAKDERFSYEFIHEELTRIAEVIADDSTDDSGSRQEITPEALEDEALGILMTDGLDDLSALDVTNESFL